MLVTYVAKCGKLSRPTGTKKSQDKKWEEYKEIINLINKGYTISDVAKPSSKGISTLQRIKNDFCDKFEIKSNTEIPNTYFYKYYTHFYHRIIRSSKFLLIFAENINDMIFNSVENLKNRMGFLFTDEEMYPRENADRNSVVEAFNPIVNQVVDCIIQAGNDYQVYAESHPVARRENNFVSTMLHGLMIEKLQQIPDVHAEKIGKTRNTILRYGSYKLWVKKLDNDGKPNINKTKSSVKRINQRVDGTDTLPMLILGYQLDDVQRITNISICYMQGDKHLWAPIDIGDKVASSLVTISKQTEAPLVKVKANKKKKNEAI